MSPTEVEERWKPSGFVFPHPFGYPRVSDVARPSVYCLLGVRENNAVGVFS